jgi:putative heme-binding domain-containing protein
MNSLKTRLREVVLISLAALQFQPASGAEPKIAAKRVATPANTISSLPGFRVELLRAGEPGEGSWVCLTTDPKGRLIISPQDGEPMFRITLTASGKIGKLEKIDVPVNSAMGLLYAYDSLYVSGKGPKGLGLYRLRDTDKDDQFDDWELLREFGGAAGEHGSHALRLGPDGKLYYMNGNFVKVPKDISPQSQHRNYAEDQLLPRGPDGNGFGNNNPTPGGFVLRMDKDAKEVELFASGFRNTYDFAINPQGELFGFDSDMEWDWGMPWYRPTRVNHIVSGGDFGFREGTGKWPIHYPDSLPTTLDIGIGSPTGVTFGTGAKFPARYQRALFIMDWSYGRIFAVHLTPKGSTYSATSEVFVRGKPLNLTDMEFGKDGALYFLIGGRKTATGLYRVSYVGSESTKPAPVEDNPVAAKARALRHQLEAFHGHEATNAVSFAWPHLNSDDRWIRYAARLAIESQPVEQWRDRSLKETKTEAALTTLLALARHGGKDAEAALIQRMQKFSFNGLNDAQKLEFLRVYGVAFSRMGRPTDWQAAEVVRQIDPHYPDLNWTLNRELALVLIYLEAPLVVPKTLALLKHAPTQEDQVHFLFHLRTLKTGWTADQRKEYLSWFSGTRQKTHLGLVTDWFWDAGRDYSDGASFPKFVAYFRKDAVAAIDEQQKTLLSSLLETEKPIKPATAPQRTLVREWKMEDLVSAIGQASNGRSFERGKEAYTVAQCAACHRFGDAGGPTGPDLTAIASRFSRRDILKSIVEPSKVLSEQFQNTIFRTKDGDDITGRVIEDGESNLVVETDPLTQKRVTIKKADIASRTASKLSPMPEGLVNVLNREEILDLLAYLESAGNKSHAAFKP